MGKKQILMILLIAALAIGIFSLYSTFAYNEEAVLLGETNANYNLIYSIKNSSNKTISVNAHDEKYIDITLNNTYDADLKYGMYYKLMNTSNVNSVFVNIVDDSLDPIQSIIRTNETKVVSLIIRNESDDNVTLVVGALVGFVQGKIEDLQKDGEILIK